MHEVGIIDPVNVLADSKTDGKRWRGGLTETARNNAVHYPVLSWPSEKEKGTREPIHTLSVTARQEKLAYDITEISICASIGVTCAA